MMPGRLVAPALFPFVVFFMLGVFAWPCSSHALLTYRGVRMYLSGNAVWARANGAALLSDSALKGIKDQTSKTGFGLGAQLEILTSRSISVAAGVIWLNKKIVWCEQDVSVYPYLMLPVTMRFWPFPYLFVGMGAYYARLVGPVSPAPLPVPFEAWGIKGYDYGILAGGGLAFQFIPGFSLFGDGWYAFGLPNISQNPPTATTVFWRDIIVQFGVRFGW